MLLNYSFVLPWLFQNSLKFELYYKKLAFEMIKKKAANKSFFLFLILGIFYKKCLSGNI